MSDSKTAADLANHVQGILVGDGSISIERIADLEGAAMHEIAYVDNEKFFSVAAASKASCLIVPTGTNDKFNCPALIEVGNPKLAFALIGALLHPPVRREPLIHPTAVVAPTADIAASAYLGPHVS